MRWLFYAFVWLSFWCAMLRSRFHLGISNRILDTLNWVVSRTTKIIDHQFNEAQRQLHIAAPFNRDRRLKLATIALILNLERVVVYLLVICAVWAGIMWMPLLGYPQITLLWLAVTIGVGGGVIALYCNRRDYADIAEEADFWDEYVEEYDGDLVELPMMDEEVTIFDFKSGGDNAQR